MSSTTQISSALTAEDLKFLISILDYSLFACPVEGGIEKGDGTTANRDDFESIQKKLKELLNVTTEANA